MKTRRDVRRNQSQCSVCARWFSDRHLVDSDVLPICSWACYIEHRWRRVLCAQGVTYYPNPDTHDKLGRKINRSVP